MDFTNDLNKLEEILNKYNESLYKDEQPETFKSFPDGFLAIQNTYKQSNNIDKIKIKNTLHNMTI